MNLDLGGFGRELWHYLPLMFARLMAAWVVVFCFLLLLFRVVKSRLRPHVLRADDRVRAIALSLRYRGQDVFGGERVFLTWFMRFWTNFASAPSLSFWSLMIPLWFYAHRFSPPPFAVSNASTEGMASANNVALWMIPGACFCGSMLLSNILKRIFKRLRPERAPGSFGHKMKDASFPSGHSLTSFCFWAVLTLTLALAGASLPFVALFGVLSVVVVGFTGLSRVYMGVHHPSDVFGGYVIGAVWSLVAFLAVRGLV